MRQYVTLEKALTYKIDKMLYNDLLNQIKITIHISSWTCSNIMMNEWYITAEPDKNFLSFKYVAVLLVLTQTYSLS